MCRKRIESSFTKKSIWDDEGDEDHGLVVPQEVTEALVEMIACRVADA